MLLVYYFGCGLKLRVSADSSTIMLTLHGDDRKLKSVSVSPSSSFLVALLADLVSLDLGRGVHDLIV